MDWAQIDSAFVADPKFQRLRCRIPNQDDFNSAVGAWVTALAGAWRAEERGVGVAPDDTRFFPDLVAVGLLDSNGDIPETAWQHWFVERVVNRRKADAERKKAARTSGGVQRTPAESRGPLIYSSMREVDGEEPEEYSPPPAPSPAAPRDSWEHRMEVWMSLAPVLSELTGVAYPSPSNGFATSLVEDVDAFGLEKVIETMRIVAKASPAPDVRALAFGARHALRTIPKVSDVQASVIQIDRAQQKREREQERLRATYGPGGAMYGDPLPEKFGGKTWQETYGE